MTLKSGLSIALVSSALGCASNTADELLPGFTPDVPTDSQLQLISPIIPDIAPGTDITFCSYLDYKADRDFDVVGYKGFQSQEGHHNILYAANRTRPTGTHECTEDDMTNVAYLGGGGTDATVKAEDLPPGIVFRVKQGTQLMILSHWINASDRTISGQVAYNVDIESPLPDSSPANLFTVVDTQFSAAPGTSSVHTECTMKTAMQMFLVGQHAHEHAVHMTLSKIAADNTTTIVQDIPWDASMVFDTPLLHFTKEAPFTIDAGDKLAVDCTYSNTTGAPIPFPSEMCVGYGYFFPADAEIDCVDGIWPQ